MAQKWIEQLDDLTIKFNDEFEGLSNPELNWKPDDDTWSIGQVIDHVIVVAQSYESTFRELEAGTYKAPFIARIGFLVNMMGKTILGGSGPDRKRKIRTFPVWEPSQSDIGEDIWARFDKIQLQLQEWIGGCGDLVGQGIVISSPANRKIVYKLETAFDIIVAHEHRHLEQAREVLSLMNSHQDPPEVPTG